MHGPSHLANLTLTDKFPGIVVLKDWDEMIAESESSRFMIRRIKL